MQVVLNRFKGLPLRVIKAFVFVALGGSAAAMAAPVTFTFSGVVTRYVDRTLGTDNTYTNGEVFSGTYTIDTANAEEPWRMLSRSGCASYQFGVCKEDFGGGAPVFTDWTLTLGSQSWALLPNVSNQAVNTQSVSTPTVKQMYWGQYQTVIAGAPAQATVYTTSLNISTGNADPLAGYPNHDEAPDVAGNDFSNFMFIDTSYTCRYVVGQGCWNTPVNSGMSFEGVLTSWDIATVSADPAAVPEPGSLVLLGLGLGCLFALRRKSHTALR